MNFFCKGPARAAMLLFFSLPWCSTAAAQGSAPVYRCPGPPVLYTDALTADEARERGCRTIDAAAITIIQAPPRPRTTANNGAGGGSAAAPAASRPSEARVDAPTQRQRDTDARRILEAELRREEDKLAALRREFNNGEPERRGDERNYQNYLDRVAQMKANIARTEADIASIKREIAKLPS